jgi:DNA-binding NarL/FixJ family response regulator
VVVLARTKDFARARTLRGGHLVTPRPSRLVLCVLPPGWRGDSLRALLAAYEFAFADHPAQALRLARRGIYDLYLLHSPLAQAQPALLCARIRGFDRQTPLIVYSIQPTTSERSAALDAGAQAYVSRSDGATNLTGTAGQLVMLAELRSMDALRKGAKAIHDHLAHGLAALNAQVSGARATLRAKLQRQLKDQASSIFTQAGGSRAHFERLWPSLFQSALERSGAPAAHSRVNLGARVCASTTG